jgi:hypothetical protein
MRGWSMATALFLLVLGGSWLTVRIQVLQHGLEQVRKEQVIPTAAQQESQQQLAQLREQKDQLASKLERQQKQSAALEQELAALRASPPTPSSSSMVAFALTPGRVRDMGGVKKVLVPASANWVRVELELGAGDYKRYQAVLQKDNGEEISSWITPKVKMEDDTEAVVLGVPAKLLPHGDYALKLSGMTASGSLEDVGKYHFRVVQK